MQSVYHQGCGGVVFYVPDHVREGDSVEADVVIPLAGMAQPQNGDAIACPACGDSAVIGVSLYPPS